MKSQSRKFNGISLNASIELAANGEAKDFESLLGHPHPWVRRKLAQNSQISSEILGCLAQDPDHTVRSLVGANPNTSPEVLEVLARDGNPEIRVSIAKSATAPEEILLVLADDPVVTVKRAVARSRNTTFLVRERLEKCDDARVQKNLEKRRIARDYAIRRAQTLDAIERVSKSNNLENIDNLIRVISENALFANIAYMFLEFNFSDEVILAFVNHPEPFVRQVIAEHYVADMKLLSPLAYDKNVAVRCKLAENRNLSEPLMEVLRKDRSKSVRLALDRNYAYRRPENLTKPEDITKNQKGSATVDMLFTLLAWILGLWFLVGWYIQLT